MSGHDAIRPSACNGLLGGARNCTLSAEVRLIDLEAHWWGVWLAPSITMVLAAVLAKIGGVLLRSSVRDTGGRDVALRQVAAAEAVARMFQVSFLALTTLMVLCFTSRSDRLTDFLFKGYCGVVVLSLVVGFLEGRARGIELLQNRFVLAFALALTLSLLVGVIIHILIIASVHEYVQTH